MSTSNEKVGPYGTPAKDDAIFELLTVRGQRWPQEDPVPGQPDPSTIDAEGDRIDQSSPFGTRLFDEAPLPTAGTPLSGTHAFSVAVMNLDAPGYGSLARVLRLAFEQSAEGKGRERHANSKAFLRQPIMENGRIFGDGFTSGQAVKKLQELHGMIQRGHFTAAKREALGAIVYAAATYLLIEEIEEEHENPEAPA